MVARQGTNKKLLQEVAEIYTWIDQQIHNHSDLAGRCDACGRCCDFEAFDHRLFVTPPEIIFLAANLEGEDLRSMQSGVCPYNANGRCAVYKYRFAGCRIFCCRGDADFQSRLSEMSLSRFKSICIKFQIPYRYVSLTSALDSGLIFINR